MYLVLTTSIGEAATVAAKPGKCFLQKKQIA